jgi:hypothetical protein
MIVLPSLGWSPVGSTGAPASISSVVALDPNYRHQCVQLWSTSSSRAVWIWTAAAGACQAQPEDGSDDGRQSCDYPDN